MLTPKQSDSKVAKKKKLYALFLCGCSAIWVRPNQWIQVAQQRIACYLNRNVVQFLSEAWFPIPHQCELGLYEPVFFFFFFLNGLAIHIQIWHLNRMWLSMVSSNQPVSLQQYLTSDNVGKINTLKYTHSRFMGVSSIVNTRHPSRVPSVSKFSSTPYTPRYIADLT